MKKIQNLKSELSIKSKSVKGDFYLNADILQF